MFFSLIVVTTNRLALVERFFYSLVHQSYKNFEVLFVHGANHTLAAQAIVEKFKDSLAIKTFASPSHSASSARNIPMSAARGDIIAFPDDDCVYPSEVLYTANAIFTAHPEIDALLGTKRDLNIWKEDQKATSTNTFPVKNCFDAFQDSETYLQMYRRHCVSTVGLFDETLGPGTGLPYGSGEDTDYVLRTLKAGFKVFRAPGIIVAHPAVTLNDPALHAKARSYAFGRMRLLQKHSMPLWFELANIFYPLLHFPIDCLPILRYRWTTFTARLKASITNRINKGR